MSRGEAEYRERRDFIRLQVSTAVPFRGVHGESGFQRGETINLSDRGVHSRSDEPVSGGDLLVVVKVMPEHERIQPLEAQGRVIPCVLAR